MQKHPLFLAEFFFGTCVGWGSELEMESEMAFHHGTNFTAGCCGGVSSMAINSACFAAIALGLRGRAFAALVAVPLFEWYN